VDRRSPYKPPHRLTVIYITCRLRSNRGPTLKAAAVAQRARKTSSRSLRDEVRGGAAYNRLNENRSGAQALASRAAWTQLRRPAALSSIRRPEPYVVRDLETPRRGRTTMEDSLSTIAVLTKSGYKLTLFRSPSGRCWADLRHGWILRKRVRVDLDRDRYEQVKKMLGTGMTRKRVRVSRSTSLAG